MSDGFRSKTPLRFLQEPTLERLLDAVAITGSSNGLLAGLRDDEDDIVGGDLNSSGLGARRGPCVGKSHDAGAVCRMHGRNRADSVSG